MTGGSNGRQLQGATVLAYLLGKTTALGAAALLLFYPGMRLSYAADLGLFNVYTCYTGPTNTPITSSTTKNTSGSGLNDAGTAVGSVELTNGEQRGYLFQEGTCYPFDFPNASATFANAIGSNGVVVGAWDDSARHRHGFFFTGQWNNYDVPGSTGTSIEAIGGDSNAILVGQFATASRTSGFYVVAGRAFLVDVPGATSTNLTGITKDDVLLGSYTTPDNLNHGFYIVHGMIYTFDVPNARHTIPVSINDNYEIVGYFQNSSGQWHSFSIMNGVFTYFDVTQPNTRNTLAQGINVHGAVGGQVTGAEVDAFVTGDAGYGPSSTAAIPPALPGGSFQWQSNHPDGGQNQCTGEPTGYIYDAGLAFASGGTVQLQLDIILKYTPDGCTPCAQNSGWNFGGTYAAFGPHLRLNVQGQETFQDTCNGALNFQRPSGPFNYDWLWVASVLSSGRLLDLQTQNQLGSQFARMLLANPG